MQLFITHKEFIDGYKSGKLIVNLSTEKKKNIDTILSPPTEELKQYGNIFWSFWRILIPGFLMPFVKKYFVHGLKNYDKYVIKAILEDKSLFEQSLLKKEITISDVQGNNYVIDESNS